MCLGIEIKFYRGGTDIRFEIALKWPMKEKSEKEYVVPLVLRDMSVELNLHTVLRDGVLRSDELRSLANLHAGLRDGVLRYDALGNLTNGLHSGHRSRRLGQSRDKFYQFQNFLQHCLLARWRKGTQP